MSKYSDTELALIGHSGYVWIKLLKAREERILKTVQGEFRNGMTDFLPLITEFVLVREQIKELESALAQNQPKTSN